ncbi:MAG TPA: 7-carboxy-7-deazaguanine synthase [Acetobacteraceae bacterium]|jgi:7-carboxy-7-deazaguanine synthase|nr:7-carboxy-7-deazaguanine synthase [Acetobacteraceae bacterium]
MSYTVKELFLTAQGEGANIGRVAVFIRFAGCNLWSGREEDRGKAVCRFCDTDFVGGQRFGSAEALADAAAAKWRTPDAAARMTVLTGGEPLLQVAAALIEALRQRAFYVALETNGTQKLPAPVDWLCVSPKAGAPLVLGSADELKLVYPQVGAEPEMFAGFPASHHWLSPMDGHECRRNTEAAAAYCLAHPQWRLAIQAHKSWGLP